MSAVAAAAPLDLARIRRRIREVRRTLAQARDELIALYDELQPSKGWTKLGHASWEDLCAAELPELRQMMTVGEKKALVIELRREHNWSLRAAAAPAGVSAPTAKTWLDDAGVVVDKVRARDGSLRAGTGTGAPRRRRTPLTDRVVLLLASAGPDGLTVRDIARELRTERHLIAPTLTRLEDAGRIVYRRPARRGLFGTYVGRIVP